MNLLSPAFSELGWHARLAVTIALASALAIMLGCSALALERALREASSRAVAPFDLLIGPPGGARELVPSTVLLRPGALHAIPWTFIEELRADPRVASWAPVQVLESADGQVVVGTTSALFRSMKLAEGDAFRQEGECVAGGSLPTGLGQRASLPGLALEQSADVADAGPVECTVVGRLAPSGTPWDRAILFPMRIGAVSAGTSQVPPSLMISWLVVATSTSSDRDALRAQYARNGITAVAPTEASVPLHELLAVTRTIPVLAALTGQAAIVAFVLLYMVAQAADRLLERGRDGAPVVSRRFPYFDAGLRNAGLLLIAVMLGSLGAGLLVDTLAHAFARNSALSLAPVFGATEGGFIAAVVAVGCLLTALQTWMTTSGSPTPQRHLQP